MIAHKSFIEELKLFYNKYLNIGLGDQYLEGLIKRYTLMLDAKKDLSNSTSLTMEEFTFSEDDYKNFSKIDQEFLNFIPFSCISLNDKIDIVIDAYGNINRFIYKKNLDLPEKQELNNHLHQSIFNFLEEQANNYEYLDVYEEAENIILQNLLVSKIFKAIYEAIVSENNLIEASIFILANPKIFSYEDNLNKLINYEELFKNKLAYSRSRR